MTVQTSRGRIRAAFALMVTGLILCSTMSSLEARPVPKGGKGDKPAPQRFIRQQNTYSNMRFFFTNRGVLFNSDASAGLFWPRTGNNAYIFGSGVWFATKKVINGRRQKLAEIGYNPNSGAGWFTEGEYFPAGKEINDGSSFDSKYISYVSPRYDRTSGAYIGGAESTVPPPAYNWPIWDAPVLDTNNVRTLRQNYYFGDYISNVNDRTIEKLSKEGRQAKPAILSQEDIVNIYSDYNTEANPEYKPGRGYPFFLNIQEVIYSWSFGRYRDMIFLRHRITNAGEEDLLDCYIAPAFDPDLGKPGQGPAQNDRNAYMSEETIIPEHFTVAQRALKEADPDSSRFGNKLENLNMAYQYSEPEEGQRYGMIGFAFLESPAVDPQSGEIQDNSEPGPDGLPRPQLGLTTFKKWTIANDPPTQDLRYDFVSSGSRDNDTGPGDVRLLFSTGPFTLKPGRSAETVIGIGIARVSTTQDNPNLDSLIKLMVQAHNVFKRVSIDTLIDSTDPGAIDTAYRATINHFDAPEPPKLPTLKAQGLDKAVLLTWDNVSEQSVDPQAEGLPWVGYELWRSTRSDLDSNIRPEGNNPVMRLGRWALYDFVTDTVFLKSGGIGGFRYRRTSNIPNEIPHSFLDVGDDNKDGTITGQEGLTNGVRYYYYLVAFDEYDSVNNIGPLTTAIVRDINFVSAIPTKPPFINAPLTAFSDLTQNCLANKGLDTIRLDVVDQGRFQALYTNDTVSVKVQPRWNESGDDRYAGWLEYYFDISDTRQGRALTYDELSGTNVAPFGEQTGLFVRYPGAEAPDSTWRKRFTSDQTQFAPNQTIDQTFRLIVDYTMTRLNEKYRVASVTSEGFDKDVVRLSVRTRTEGRPRPDLANLSPLDTRPHFLGSLGETTYEIRFGDPVNMREVEFDTATKRDVVVTQIEEGDGAIFKPKVLPITIVSKTHCDAPLKVIRDGRTNDVEKAYLEEFYNDSLEQAPNFFAAFSDPDTMLVPIAGHYAVDAYHYSFANGTSASDAIAISTSTGKTTGMYYYPYNSQNSSNGKTLTTVHRIRLAGAEIILNAPGIADKGRIGDDTPPRGDVTNQDIGPGDKITISFAGLAKNMPFPDSAFQIVTSRDKIDFTNAQLYTDTVLEQVQIVPNPYIVTHAGQTSTDNAKLYFTRLPPRATIEIYNIAGDLIKTLEHNAYINGGADLAGNASMLEWNLLSEGRQRIGSQVLTARVIAKDQGGSVTGEVLKKFAVVVGGYRIVR